MERLLKMKEALERSGVVANELAGELKALTAQLKEYGCDTYEAAEKKLQDLDSEIEKREEELEEGIKVLEDEYDWSIA